MEQHARAMKKPDYRRTKMEHVEKNESMETIIKDLGNKMEEALLQDRKNNENKMPGILRFKMLTKIENTLRKTEQW